MTLTTIALSEAARECGVEKEEIIQFIEDDWIAPFDRQNQFLDREDIERIKLIYELKDLGVNNDAVPIILHLIDQLNVLHQNLHRGLQY